MNIKYPRIIFVYLLTLVFGATLFAQTKETDFVSTLTTEFTYQGKLTDNNAAANGNYDFEFRLMDGNGAVIAVLQRPLTPVTNGIFTVRLDYGFSPFTTNGNKFLEIGVKPAGNAAYVTLSPRQPVTATPIAINSSFAVNSSFANLAFDSQKLGGVEANQYVLTGDTRLSDARTPLPGSTNYIQNSLNEQAANFTINGVGSAALLQALTVGAQLQYSLGGAKFITAPGTNNTFLGITAGTNWTTGADNSFFGKNAGQQTTNGSGNSFFGSNAGRETMTGLQNSFFGSDAGAINQTGSYNSFFGAMAGKSATQGNGNSFFGAWSGLNTTSGGDNSFFGNNSGYTNTTGIQNSYFGAYAGRLGGNVAHNAFFGAYAGNNNSGNDNSFFGSSAGFNNGGNGNSFFGSDAGESNTSGLFNSFFGINSGNRNTVGQFNAFYGANSGFSNTQGNHNTFLGNEAGIGNTTGTENVFIGSGAGASNTTGNLNIYIGRNAGGNLANGTQNIAIGDNTSIGPNVTNSVVIGGASGTNISNQIVLGNSQQTTVTSGRLQVGVFGSPGTLTLCTNGNNFISLCSSSIRYKKDIENFTPGLDLIKRLRPVTFTWKDGGMRDLGFVAEEVAAVEPLMTTQNEKGETEGVKYDRISTALVNAVGEQQTQIEAQNEQIRRQQTQIEAQAQQLKIQQSQIDALKKLVCAADAKAEICQEKK